MGWREDMEHECTLRGHKYRGYSMGLAIEFPDGYDDFWILPGEVMSTIPVPAEGPPSPGELLATFEHVGALRERVLHVLRHFLVKKGARINRYPNGEWGVDLGEMSTTVSVGASLTAELLTQPDIRHGVDVCMKYVGLGKTPSAALIARFLQLEGPPKGEQAIDPDNDCDQPCSTIEQAIRLMGVWKAIEHADAPRSADELRAAAEPSGRVGQALMQLASRLPGVEASCNLDRSGQLCLEFTDGFASHEIDVRSRRLAASVRAMGPIAAGEQLADEYLALNGLRSRTLQAIFQAAAARGWKSDRCGVLGGDDMLFLGDTRREVGFPPADELTDLLRKLPPERALARLFASEPEFAAEAIAALSDPSPGQTELPCGRLAPKDLPAVPPLFELTPPLIAELDDHASAVLQPFLEEHVNQHHFHNPIYFDPQTDTWASTADWVRLAERHLAETWPCPSALLKLLDVNHPAALDAARSYIERHDQHDVGDFDVQLVWRLRRECPMVASAWFRPTPNWAVPYAGARAAIGDPIAVRHLERALDNKPPNALDEIDPFVLSRLTVDAQRSLHDSLLEWARTTHRWNGPNDSPLKTALHFRWSDIASALETNPFMLSGLLTVQDRPDQSDEPGILGAGSFLLLWSRLDPSPLLARLIATAFKADLRSMARAAAEAGVARKPELSAMLSMTFDVYDRWLDDMKAPMAIAWTRCRRGICEHPLY